jgi:hypothetical protein
MLFQCNFEAEISLKLPTETHNLFNFRLIVTNEGGKELSLTKIIITLL